jgi:iron complex transport system substrate-binding protein
MNAKNKIFAFLEIAIVLCSVFLVALPAIAAEQNTQKISASTITTASEDDFVLGIYGNANEDDTIDMRDLTYVKLIFFGKKSETELADAKYDGKINPLDFIQIKLIIVGKEKELTLVDSADRIVTVKKPVERIIPLTDTHADGIRVLGAVDKVVGVGTEMKDKPLLYPEMSKLPDVGFFMNPDIEAIPSLSPDLVLAYEPSGVTLADRLKETDIKVFCFNLHEADEIVNDFKIMGYIFDEGKEAEEFIEWYNEWRNEIKARTEGLSEDEKPRVYLEWFNDYMTDNGYVLSHLCTIAGGTNIAADLPQQYLPTVDPEWVIEQNPDIIIKMGARNTGYDVDDITGIKAERDKIMNRPGLENIKAVKNGNVYIISVELLDGPQIIVAAQYYAKWFHPELFKDWDPQAFHQEYLDSFHKDLNFNVYENGVFVYSEPG